jgi:aminomethyltransferase
MDHPATTTLRQTSLHAVHQSLGARMMPFAGWDMPVEYSGIVAEHMAVRTRAGLFDVSHMGEIEVAGRDALAAIQLVTSNDASRLSVGQAQYSALTTPTGAFVDDVLVYRLAAAHFLLVVNAANVDKDYAWIARHLPRFDDAVAIDASSRYALIAIQGPASREILQTTTGVMLDELKYYRFATGEVCNVKATVSRTGYTGEIGYEMFVPPQSAARVWNGILDAGRTHDVVPAGLGARDTLRLEAAMRLYGNDIDDTTSVLEADLEWIVSWTKGDFIGRDALFGAKTGGVARRLVGFEMLERAIARRGCRVLLDHEPAGVVTSGTQTPYLKKAIGFAYVPSIHSSVGTVLEIEIRGKLARAQVVETPFYKRSGS